MDIGEILGDALRYPFTQWKNFFIFGIILMLASLYTNMYSASTNISQVEIGVFFFLLFIGFLFSMISYGYDIRILASTLSGFHELPEFNSWIKMLVDGLKVLIIGIVYTIPLIIITITSILLLGLSIIGSGITSAHNPVVGFYLGIIIVFIILYVILIIPFLLMSIANMTYNGGEIEYAFKFGKIFKKISNIGWINFLVWYIITGIIYIVISFIGLLFNGFFHNIHLNIVGVLLVSLIIRNYVNIYLFRSVALFYMSGTSRYLECEKCGGYYELQKGESPEDFELNCSCGGKLNSYYSYDGNTNNIKAPKHNKTSSNDYKKKVGIKNLEKSIEKTDDGYRFKFKDVQSNILADIVQCSFEEDGYKLEDGTPTSGVYGAGSHMDRMIAGGLSERYKFKVQIYDDDENSYLRITKAMSGWSGGYMAVRSLNKEYKRILFKINSI